MFPDYNKIKIVINNRKVTEKVQILEIKQQF